MVAVPPLSGVGKVVGIVASGHPLNVAVTKGVDESEVIHKFAACAWLVQRLKETEVR